MMPDPKSTAAAFTKRLSTAFGTDLQSVVLFGSVARGEAIPAVSDVNLLVLVSELKTTHLVAAAPLAQQWVRSGNTPPHVYTLDEWSGMGDTFAIEIADMKDAREVIFGADSVSQLASTPAELRQHA